MRLNVPVSRAPVLTHEGAPARRFTALAELRRAVLGGFLHEDAFYERGEKITARIAALVSQVAATDVAALAVEARTSMHLRHAPLLLVRELARQRGNGSLVADTLEAVIARPDELTEYLAIYWKGQADAEKSPLSAGSKRGLARAFRKFSAEALAKYDRDSVVTLRDVLRLTHAKPASASQAATWKRVVARELAAPDTWEVALSRGADPKATFERLLAAGALGALAFLRNLRTMVAVGVDPALIRARLAGRFDDVLPFRFIAAARHAPAFATELDAALRRAVAGLSRLTGRTVVLVDVSGSMDGRLSGRSEITRVEAAAGLAVLARELADARVFTFSDALREVPAWHGLPLVEAIQRSQPHGGTRLGAALDALHATVEYDRLLVLTDEQSHDAVAAPRGRGYMINVAPYQRGVGDGPWVRIDGWSERLLDYVVALEAEPGT